MKADIQSSCEVLYLTSNENSILPHAPTRIVGRSERGALMLERLIFSDAGTSGGARDWVLNDVALDGVSQLEVKDLSGALFSTNGIAVRRRHAFSCLYFGGLDVIERESEVAVTVTYVGSNPRGVPFFASIIGDTPPQRPTVLPIATKNKLLPSVTTMITAVLDRPLEISMLEIEDTGTTGGAADWLVNDIRIDGTSRFTEAGDIPGDVFVTNLIGRFVKFHPGTRIELRVTYIGLNDSGCCFTARILGTVVRDSLEQPPPDVHAVVQTSGQTLDDEVVARCDWRAPYVQPRT